MNKFNFRKLEYYFVLEVSFGKWNIQNWTTCKVNSDTKVEQWYDKIVERIQNSNNKPEYTTIGFTTVLEATFVIVMIMLAIFVLALLMFCSIKLIYHRVLKSNAIRASQTNQNHSPFSNEMSVIAFRVDPPTDQIRTSFQSNMTIIV